MNKFLISFLIFAICFITFTSAIQNHLHHLRSLKVKDHHVPDLNDPSQKWFVQQLDHFNHQETRTWKQRYFVNETWWNRELNGPIFVQIGGEGPINSGNVKALEMSKYAQNHGALQLSLEHRFYGLSNPLPTLSTENLQFLSSQQALADLSNFIIQMRKQFNVTEKTRVVTFGCSYPGNLASWFRLKYPFVAVGSVANSAPVHAQLDFFQYLDSVDQSFSYFAGKQCDARISQAFSTVASLLENSTGQQQIEKDFKTCQAPNSLKDQQTFYTFIIGNFQGVDQYNNEHHSSLNIDYICNIMEDTSLTPYNALIKVNDIFVPSGQCMDISYQSQITQMKNITAGTNAAAGRSWYYQTCYEFGYYQTTDSPSSVQPFGNGLPLKYYTDMCTDTFGQDFVDPTPATNTHYGSDNPEGQTNTFFVSGTIDPWLPLEVQTNLSPTLNSYIIEGTAHCAHLFPPSDETNPPPGIAISQKLTDQHIAQWLTAGNPC